MMDVRVVGVGMRKHRMVVWMRMRLGPVPGEGVLVLVMLVMAMAMAVVERMVRVGVLVPLPQVQPQTYPHQNRCCPEEQLGRLWPKDERNSDAKKRRDREVGAGSRGPQRP